jgi:hypothetical protein
MTTMVLGGMWHGAGWNFIVWGCLHGVYLALHQLWVTVAKAMRFPVEARAWKWVATLITFAAVCVAWVFFRAPDMATASTILHGMHGGFGIALPDSITQRLHGLQPLLERAGVTSYLGGGAVFIESWGWIVFAAAVAFLCPNTQQIVRHYEPALDFSPSFAVPAGRVARALAWAPTRTWAFAIAVLALASLLALNRPADFLYFQF